MSRLKSTVGSSILRVFALVVLLCGLALLPTGAQVSIAEAASSSATVQADTDWGKMPLYFIANQGQLDEDVSYYVQGKDKNLYFTPGGMTFALTSSALNTDGSPSATEPRMERWTVALDYVGARAVTPQGEDQTETVISYFKGDQEDWQTGLPTFSSILYPELWEGIDLLYSGTQDQLKQEFHLAPGADPTQIQLSYRGADVSLNDQGELVVSTPVASFTDAAPVAYQDIDSERVYVPVEFVLGMASGEGAEAVTEYGFRLGAYNVGLPLVIDPAVLVYCGYIGGGGSDELCSVAVDGAGNVYVAGTTQSTPASFPEKVGPRLTYDFVDGFVAKVKADGTGLVYCGYIGGNGIDSGLGLAVDTAGNAYVIGTTESTQASFPVARGPDQTHNGGQDGFIAKVKADGTGLDYCGYIGGSGMDVAYGVAVDASGNAYAVGTTYSTEATFPAAVGPDLSHNGSLDTFVAKVEVDGTGLAYCGFIGGDASDDAGDIAVDASGNAYVMGSTMSYESTFPVLVGPDLTHNGNYYPDWGLGFGGDAFVAKVKADGTGLVYCGYIGGSARDDGRAIAVDASGRAYVAGDTSSPQSSFPLLVGPDLTRNGGVFVAQLRADGTGLGYCGYIGGSDYAECGDVTVDALGNAYVTGGTASNQASFPVVSGPDSTYNGLWSDAFVAKVKADGTGFVYCGYIGGADNESGKGIAVDSSGSAYVCGETGSAPSSFPVRVGPDLTYNGGHYDGFIAKVIELSPPTVTGLSVTEGPDTGGTQVVITGTGFRSVSAVSFGTTGVAAYTVDSATQITAIAPARAAGTVQVRVTNLGGSSVDTPADDFTYIATTRYQQTDTKVTCLGPWSSTSAWSASGGSLYSTSSPGAAVIMKFSGDSLWLVGKTAPWYGKALVSIDSGPEEYVDFYSQSESYKRAVYAKTGLGAGSHTLVMKYTGEKSPASSGTTISLDAVDTTGALEQAPKPTRIDDNNTSYCTYGPLWSRWDNSGYWAAYLNTYAFSDKDGATLTVNFNGVFLSWNSRTASTQGKARVTLDPGTPGERTQVIDLYTPSTSWKKSVYATGILANGLHTVVIECPYEKNPASWWYTIGVDAFDILGSL